MIIFGIIIVAVFVVVALHIRIVPQSDTYVIERLGSYYATWTTGLHVLCPIIDRVASKVSLKESVCDFAPQPVITKDNVTMQIDSVVYLKVTDAKLYTYGVRRPMDAVENLTATTLRNLVGGMKLDEALTSRDQINAEMCQILDEATDPWGIKVIRVEVKNIMPPEEIRVAMEKEMKAEREKRAIILTAEATKQQSILTAQGEKEALVLKAEAERDAKIAKAEGEAHANLALYEAQAKGIAMINEAKPNPEYLTLKSYEALEKVANGNATKVIVPSNIADVASTLTSIVESVKK